ncbi:MAG: hypothetical protein GEU71_14415 [Actinobacteria bacterium]|nr:hypothetical protein [Actinomycetota bacterium]
MRHPSTRLPPLQTGPHRAGAVGATRCAPLERLRRCRLLRCSWEAVANIVARVVADHIDDSRLDELYRIGVDEVFYRKAHRFLTVVADHDRDGAVVWAKEGRKADTLK